ncbi:MAG: DUF2251 domain-containing protein [Blastocatellia bacterium]|nr:DUF2251 domain-containing protein [Blastocatellia bacterium]
MPVNIVAEENIYVGRPIVIEGQSPNTDYGSVFEDDGLTGYFYALDLSQQDQSIVDARHIYNVEQVTDRSIPSIVEIVWSTDGLKTMLLINKYPHAVIDFDARRAYCRSGFPSPGEGWSAAVWDDGVMELFR